MIFGITKKYNLIDYKLYTLDEPNGKYTFQLSITQWQQMKFNINTIKQFAVNIMVTNKII